MITADMATTATVITPRPYQREAVQAVLDAHGQGMRRPLVALPTGTGKTIVFALLAQERGGRTPQAKAGLSSTLCVMRATNAPARLSRWSASAWGR